MRGPIVFRFPASVWISPSDTTERTTRHWALYEALKELEAQVIGSAAKRG